MRNIFKTEIDKKKSKVIKLLNELHELSPENPRFIIAGGKKDMFKKKTKTEDLDDLIETLNMTKRRLQEMNPVQKLEESLMIMNASKVSSEEDIQSMKSKLEKAKSVESITSQNSQKSPQSPSNQRKKQLTQTLKIQTLKKLARNQTDGSPSSPK
jgi:predicted nucleic acid-binding protein